MFARALELNSFQIDLRADSPIGCVFANYIFAARGVTPKCNHRGCPCRRSRKRICGGRARGQGASRPDRKGDRRDRRTDRLDSGRHRRFGSCDKADRRYHLSNIGHRNHDCSRRRRTGGRNDRDCTQCPEVVRRYASGCRQHHPGQLRRSGNRCSFLAGLDIGSFSLSSESSRLQVEVAKFLDEVRAA